MEKEILKSGWKTMKNNMHISRDIIDRYQNSSENDKRIIEGKLADNFDEDALDGWTESGLNTKQLEKLDETFYRQTKSTRRIARNVSFIILFGISLIAVFFLLKNNTTQQTLKSPIQLVIDKSDVALPHAINQLKALPTNQQISKKEVLIHQSHIRNVQSASHEKQEDFIIDEKTLSPLPVTIIQHTTEIAKQTKAAEIYLHAFKAIDYTKYRERPKIESEQITLTGTSADIEYDKKPQVDATFQSVAIPYIDYLQKTLGYLNKSNWKQALTRFNKILETYPDDLNARFYSGLCYYNLQEYNKACVAFSTCLQLSFSNFNEEAQWYLALAKKSNGEIDDAKKLFDQIRLQNGYYSKQAEKIITE